MPSVDDLCRSYLDLKWHFDPAAASADGVVAEDSRLGRFDAEGVREYVAALRSVAGAVEELDVDDLQEEIDRTALLGDIRVAMSRWEREQPHRRDPSFWLSHLFNGIYAVLRRADGVGGNRVTPILARLKETPAFLDAARSTVDAPPSVFVDTALGMLGGGGELIAQAVGVLSSESPELAPELATAAQGALEGLARFGHALRDEIEPSEDPQAFAVGEEQFSRRLHFEHALAAEAPTLWRYGTHLQAEIEAELAAAAAKLGGGTGNGSWRDVVERLREDAPAPGEMLDAYRAELDRAREFLLQQGLVTVPPDTIDVVATPPFLAPLMPFAAYEPPPIHLRGQSGRFYVTLPPAGASAEVIARQRREHCVHGIPSLVAHEAYPGHHLQLTTAHHLTSETRQHLWTPVMVEGWALYCEQLMAETGFYRTPEVRLFQLVNLLWRAIRILLDVGLHTRGMTPPEAVQYLVDHLPMERRNAEAEVRRYCAYPTYQLSYAVGRRELLHLRDDYRNRAGGEYSPRRFHDELLRYGGLPVSLARWGMGISGE